jgi:hypothetical protein
VEAAVAAINALLSGTASTPRPPPQAAALNRQPLAEGAAGAHGGGFSSPPQAGVTGGPHGSSPSFYRALMATGGVLRPPGGPPIPLNVDYATEIQPHLGRLLGRGGFGAVYEGTWRGQRVRRLAPCACVQTWQLCVAVNGFCDALHAAAYHQQGWCRAVSNRRFCRSSIMSAPLTALLSRCRPAVGCSYCPAGCCEAADSGHRGPSSAGCFPQGGGPLCLPEGL